MKIIIIISLNPYFQSSATTNRWLTLIEGLSQLGAKVELLIYGGYQSEKEAKAWKTLDKLKGVAIKYIAPHLVQGYWKTRYYIYIGEKLRERRLLNLILKELEKKDGIVWTDASHFGFNLAVQLKKHQPNQQLFLEFSEFLDIHQYNKGNFLQRWQANKRQQFFEKTAFHVYEGLALMTRTLFNHYQQFPEPRPKLLHLPMTVDLERFNKEIQAIDGFEMPYIAFVGVMNDAKDGVSILIKAFVKIAIKFPKLKLYLIGGWNYDTPIHSQLIKENRMEDKIFWKGELDRDQIPAIIKNATLLALPRPDSKQAQGGFPTKLGEYLSTGNPVCATTVGEIPDYITDGDSVFFAKPGSVTSFAEAMDRALCDSENAKRVGLNGRKVAEREFNKHIQAKILYNFLKENLTSNQK
jgi:glycosyltransferase involved in cell wall biosynthesis